MNADFVLTLVIFFVLFVTGFIVASSVMPKSDSNPVALGCAAWGFACMGIIAIGYGTLSTRIRR